MTNIGPQVKIHRDPQQADNIINNHNAPHRANQIIIAFLTGTIGTMSNQDRQGSMKDKINYIPLVALPLHLHSLQDPTCLVGQ